MNARLPQSRGLWNIFRTDRFRQLYLGYLQAEAKSLAGSLVCLESGVLVREVEAIQLQLAWASKNILYIDVPPNPNADVEELLRRFFPELRNVDFDKLQN